MVLQIKNKPTGRLTKERKYTIVKQRMSSVLLFIFEIALKTKAAKFYCWH